MLADLAQTDPKAVLAQLTLDEKIALLTGDTSGNTASNPRIGLPGLKYPARLHDGPRNGQVYGDTTGLRLAATFDAALTRDVAAVVAESCKHEGTSAFPGPNCGILRNPVSRNAQGIFSEDPHLSGTMASEFVSGLQRSGVGATLWPFLCHEADEDGDPVDVVIPERALREIYLSPFQVAQKAANPLIYMASSAHLNGVHCSENKWLLDDVLRQEWGFEGLVISDWDGTYSTDAALNAGLDIEMPGSGRWRGDLIKQLLRVGKLTMHTINARVLTVIKTIQRIAPISPDSSSKAEHSQDGPKEELIHTPPALDPHSVLRKAAVDSIVLLKNSANALPISKSSTRRIGIIGLESQNNSIAAAIRQHFSMTWDSDPAEAPFIEVVPIVEGGHSAAPYVAEAEALTLVARDDMDVVVVVIAVHPFGSSSLDLPDSTNELVSRILDARPKAIIVNQSNLPVAMPWINKAATVLQIWSPNDEYVDAVVEVLFGRTNPSGRLPVTFPKRIQDCTAYLNSGTEGGSVLYGEGIFVGYRGYEEIKCEPLFHFGHGFSYSTFEWTRMRVSVTQPSPEDVSLAVSLRLSPLGSFISTRLQQPSPTKLLVTVSLMVTNFGPYPGAEVAQLYVSDPVSSLRRPKRELKAFEKVFLDVGETKTLEFTLDKMAFSYWDDRCHAWVVEKGEFVINAARSADEMSVVLNESIVIKETITWTGL